jgi:hypothetical protein
MGIAARQDNAISYVSPRWGGLEVRGQYSFGEKSATIGRGYGVSARYQVDSFDLNAGFQQQDGADNAASGKVSAMVLGGPMMPASPSFSSVRRLKRTPAAPAPAPSPECLGLQGASSG